MKFLVFNTVVLAALGYLFLSDGRLDIPFPRNAPTTAAAPAATPEVHDVAVLPEPVEPPPPIEARAPGETVFTPPPAIAEAEPVATLPVPEIPAPQEAALPEPAPSPAPQVTLAEGMEVMSRTERTRELDRLIEDMELFYIERIAR
ncbi:MAG: hypothetical protein JJ881_08730 [Alphaproteobacteria bacterium]|nr:hypothetical protein [Alphaproteobacteria bacterium]